MLETKCREFQSARNAGGYGSIWRNGRHVLVHRWVWELAFGPIPEGMFVLHHCDNPPCFLIEHLYVGTKKDNAQDKVKRGRHHSQLKTHCPKGHSYSGVAENGQRICKLCKAESVRKWKRRNWY